jgi:hypothetical protein
MTGVITQADTSEVSYGSNQTSNVFINSLGMRQKAHTVTITPPAGANNGIPDVDSVPIMWTAGGTWQYVEGVQPSYNSQHTETSIPTQTVRTKFTDLRSLATENKMQSVNSQLNLQDQVLVQTIANAQVPDLGSILDNELAVLDADLRKAQIAFALLFLTPPISGRITAIFKDVGESVAVGEPVMRIEGEDDILLVGVIQYRSAVTVGTSVTITAGEIFEGGGTATIPSRVVAVRGHDANNDEWDVMLAASNRGMNVTMPAGPAIPNVVLPLNYHFDREATTFTIP